MGRILLIEDARDLAEVVRRELEGAGYDILMAGDGKTGLDLALRFRPDLIILDWMLPGIDGLEVLRRLRAADSPLPVLMLTARSEEADRVVGLELGADDYLTKPFSMRELLARVRALLRRADRIRDLLSADQGQAAQPLSWGDLHLDPFTFETLLKGQPLDLSRTEFDLLYLFLRNPGRAFSRAYLMETVWSGSYIDGDRSVDNAVLRLRKKLDDAGEQIETVWGLGYRWRSER